MSVIIGLTGSIATGKSTVSKMFKEWEIPVVDADQIARNVVKPGEPAYEKNSGTLWRKSVIREWNA